MSARGSRCSSPFHCSPYGPAVPGPWGPVSAAPPSPGPCHQAPLASCLTHAPGPPSPLSLLYPLSFRLSLLSGLCLDMNPDLSSTFCCLLLTTHTSPSPSPLSRYRLIDVSFFSLPSSVSYFSRPCPFMRCGEVNTGIYGSH